MRKTKIIIVTVGVLISGIVLVVNIFCCLKHTRSKDCQNNYNNNFNIKEYRRQGTVLCVDKRDIELENTVDD